MTKKDTWICTRCQSLIADRWPRIERRIEYRREMNQARERVVHIDRFCDTCANEEADALKEGTAVMRVEYRQVGVQESLLT